MCEVAFWHAQSRLRVRMATNTFAIKIESLKVLESEICNDQPRACVSK
jgi:hypothetical protein